MTTSLSPLTTSPSDHSRHSSMVPSATEPKATTAPKTTTLASLPTELLLRIFILSSNPSLAVLSRDFHARIGDASKTSVATRVGFLRVRYRGQWAKMVIKGLRWRFFDLAVLQALDRAYARSIEDKRDKKEARKAQKRAMRRMEKEQVLATQALQQQHQRQQQKQQQRGQQVKGESRLLQALMGSSSSRSGSSATSSSPSAPLNPLKRKLSEEGQEQEGEEQGGEMGRQTKRQDLGAQAASRSGSPYDSFSSASDYAPSPSLPRSIYSYPALAPRSETDGDTTTPKGNQQQGEEEQQEEEEPVKIPLPPDFQIPRRLFRASSSSTEPPFSASSSASPNTTSNKHIPLVKELLQRRGSATHPANYPIIRSAQRGDLAMIRTLIRYGGAVPDQAALRWACVENHVEVVDYFLAGGGYETETIQVAEMVEEEQGQEESNKELQTKTATAPQASLSQKKKLRHGLVPNSECLLACLERGNTQMVDRLLRSGAVPDMKTLMML